MRRLPAILLTAAMTVMAAVAVSPGRDTFDSTVRIRPHNADDHPVYIIFTADSMFEGATYALDAMAERNIKASFFFTGNFLRDSLRNAPVIRRVIADGHYVGPHGDRHILLADWDRNRTPLATPDSALRDIADNIEVLGRYGIRPDSVRTIVPSFEWASTVHNRAFRAAGYDPVTPTPGIETYRDYTTPDMPEYMTAEFMYRQLLDYRDPANPADPHPLDGAIILIHLGTQDARPDKLYHRLPAILDTLTARGYTIGSLHEIKN